MIELKNVSKYYHSGDITNLGLHNVSLKLNKGEIVAITGDSGSGKSTLLNVITKIDSFDEGEILFKGNETSYFSVSDMDDFRKNKIGFIFQNYNIIDSYTVLENVMIPLVLKGNSASEAKAKALELIEKVGLSHRVKSRGTKLSGGEKQRCVIARALASDCEILACDEPTGNLDSKTGDEIIKLIKEVAKDKLVLIVTHNYDQVKDIATRRIRVADGEIVEDVCVTEFPDDEAVELDLDYVPLKNRVCAKIAKNNVIFTPKKTILLCLIFLAICISTLFMFQTIYTSTGDIKPQSTYINDLDNRLVVYDINHTAISQEKLQGYDYDKNPFTEDTGVPVLFAGTFGSDIDVSVFYSDRYNYRITQGKMPKDNTEIVLIVPNDSYVAYLLDEKTALDTYLTLNSTKQSGKVGTRYHVVGIAYSKDVDRVTVTANPDFASELYLSCVSKNLGLINTKSNKEESIVSMLSSEVKSPYIEIPYGMDKNNLKLTLFKIYNITEYVEIRNREVGDTDEGIYFKFSSANTLELPLYEASIYTKNVKKAQRELVNKDLIVDIACETSEDAKVQVLLNNLLSYVIMVFTSLALIIVFIITYVILAKVYQSKKKDYEILRTLGVTKKDMRKIVYMEVMGVCTCVMLISLIAFVIVINTVIALDNLREMKALTILIYMVSMIFFSYRLANKFNKKLFKFSVTKSMKGDAKHD